MCGSGTRAILMRPLTLKEFAENLRITGDWREVEFADEILDLIALEEEVAEPYGDLCADLEHTAPAELKDSPTKALERLNDRSGMLEEIEKHLSEFGKEKLARDPDDVVKILLGILSEAEDILEAAGWPGDGDFIDGIQALADRPAPLEFDL